MNVLLLIPILIFVVIVFASVGIFYYVRSQQERLSLIERIKREGRNSQAEGITAGSSRSGSEIKRYILNIVSSLGYRVKPKSEEEISNLRKTFLNAGYRGRNTPIIFFGIKALLAMVLPVGFLFLNLKLFSVSMISPFYSILILILLAVIGSYLPDAWLRLRIAKRKEKILQGFPDALDLLVVCVEAGMGLDAAIRRIGEEVKLSNEILSEELNQLHLELRAGKLRQDALRNLAIRTGLEEVSNLVTLLIQTDKFGTSVAQALRVHSDFMRTRRYQKAEETAAKLPVKLLFPLIFFVLPALFVTILGPAVIRIIRVLIPAVLK